MTHRLCGDGELHLARCRRRRESAWVLVARIDTREGVSSGELGAHLRVTDSVTLRRVRHGYELEGVFDDQDLVRGGLEQRLRQVLPDAGVHFGWAHFPEDGLTLPVLLECAREALPAEGLLEATLPEPAGSTRGLRRLFQGSTAEAK
jgi:hypothetical protein